MSLSYALLWMLLFLFQNVEATGWLDVHFKANEFFFFQKTTSDPKQTKAYVSSSLFSFGAMPAGW